MKISLVILFCYSLVSFGHGGIDHSKEIKLNQDKEVDSKLVLKYSKINQLYLNSVKEIFKRSCFDCHSNKTKFPWYYKVVGISTLIDNDIIESKKHLDFSNDFPFKSHNIPIEDLNAINSSIESNSMPPLRYRLLHWSSKLTKKEILSIKKWVSESKEILK